MSSSYDVIIVGGRPAGASLALRLAKENLSVLVVDKAEFPSLPEVPSCPVLYPRAMKLLDEIGLTEDQYANAVTKIHRGVIDFEPYFQTVMEVPEMFGRNYLYGFDRALFDNILWQKLSTQPLIEAKQQFRVKEILRDDSGRVVGIKGSAEGSDEQEFRANLCVVGADGRHSFVARKVGASITDDRPLTSTVHFASWESLSPTPVTGEPIIHIATNARGRSVLFFPAANGQVSIATHVRSDRADTKGDPDAYYMQHLQSFSAVRQRLQGAKQVGPLLGVRKVANRYMTHGGEGWFLVGDAVHQKDPVDGQGVYDALIETKRLSEIIVAMKQNKLSSQAALAAYQEALIQETKPMFEETMKRLKRELYEEPPTPVIRTMIRWLMQDKAYHERFFHFLGRAIEPANWLDGKLIAGACLRGMKRDVAGLFRS